MIGIAQRLRSLLVWSSIVSFCAVTHALHDNRFFPVLYHPFSRTMERKSDVKVAPFFTTASAAVDHMENEIRIPSLFGKYDQSKLADGMMMAGYPNLLRDEWQGERIIWNIEGKVQSQGVWVQAEKSFGPYCAFGVATSLMHVNATHDYMLNKSETTLSLNAGDELELEETRRNMHSLLGVESGHYHHAGLGDTQLYARIGSQWDYTMKFRHIDAGFRIGALLPSGKEMTLDNSVSVPFGGNGHFGAYLAVDAEFELKEDWRFGFLFHLSKRFERTRTRRLPLNDEPQFIGALVAPVSVDPGVCFMFAPYMNFEKIRGGFGVRLHYTLRAYEGDFWKDIHSNKDEQPAKLAFINTTSEWASDYCSVELMYDFESRYESRKARPLLWARWDIPTAFLITRRVTKTHQVSVGLEVTF